MAANPLPIYFIAYPLEDAIACEICANNIHRDENGNLLEKRQRGVFKAESRRRNYVLHLNRKHQVPVENVKIRCSVCGRVSDKPSRTAWRDARTHHQREHIADPVVVEPQVEAMENYGGEVPPDEIVEAPVVVEPQVEAMENYGGEVPVEEVVEAPVVVEPQVEAMENYGGEVPVEEVVELPYVDNAPNQVNGEAIDRRQAEILQALQPENVENGDNEIHELPSKTQLNVQKDSMKQHSPKELEDHLPMSTIIKGMGRMFDVIVSAAADPLTLVHSTPQILPQPAVYPKVMEEDKQHDPSFIAVDEKQVSRIVPRGRRPLRTYECKRLLFDQSSTSSRKKFCP